MAPSTLLLLLGTAAIAAIALFLPRVLAKATASLDMARRLRDSRTQRHSDLTLIAAYHERTLAEAGSDAIDERTWRDLDLDEVFGSVDYAASEPGRQYLYRLLRRPVASTEPLARLDRVARSLDNDGVAGGVRDALHVLADARAAYLQQLLFGDLPARPRLWWLFPVLTASALACLASLAAWHAAAIVWIGVCFVNVVVQLVYRPRVKHLVVAMHEVPAFLRAARRLGDMNLPELSEECRVLREGALRLATLRRATSWLMFEPGLTNELASAVYEYINLLFLFDVNAFVFTIDTLRSTRDVTRRMFEAIGFIDAAQSIAQWRHTLPAWSSPEFTAIRKELHAESLAHPLLVAPVPNTLEIDDVGILITGSNMSGKTTFVRALGVNAILAQTLCTVCAAVWRAPLLHVRTSIGRNDSLVEGKSYYLAEVESVLTLVRAKESGAQHLFLLDEIFRGTNTSERVAAAFAVLDHLNSGNDLVVVATHDLEVLDLLGGSYLAFHFHEQVDGAVLTFDYRLQPGPASTRNAIALLKFMRYPDSLVAAAIEAIDRRAGTRTAAPTSSAPALADLHDPSALPGVTGTPT